MKHRTIEVLAIDGIGPNRESEQRLEDAMHAIRKLIGPCLREDELETAALNTISEDMHQETQTHLDFCSRCREAVANRVRLLRLIVHVCENRVDPEFDPNVDEYFAKHGDAVQDFDEFPYEEEEL